MRAILLLSLLAVPAAAAAPAPAPASPLCKPGGLVREAVKGQPARPRRLDEEPPADLIFAVVQTRGRCIEPVLVRENIGGR
ncbi:MAG: hypothetical protein ACJ8ER_07070 [Allosphingosinicella sp.]